MPQSSRLAQVRADLARKAAMRGGVSRYDPSADPFAGVTFDVGEPDTPRNPPPPPPPQTVNDPASSGWGKYGGMATRALGAIIGNSGGWWGAAASGASEAAAEKLEGREINPWQVGFQSVLGAIPLGRLLGKGASIAGSAIKGALFSTAGTAGTALAEGELPSLKDLETSAVVGGVTGGAMHGLRHAMGSKVPTRAVTAAERVPPVERVAAPLENEALRMARAEQPVMNFDTPTPERGSQLAQEAILGAHATAARYSKLQAALAAQQGKTSALIDRLSAAARRAEERAAGTVAPDVSVARQPQMFSPDELAGVPAPKAVRPTPSQPTLDDLLHTLAPDSGMTLEQIAPNLGRVLNGSGESAASMEAINRVRSMANKGEQFVVYDRTGARRPLIGVDAVDYTVRPGETYGVETPTGFRVLDDAGGRYPNSAVAPNVAPPKATKPHVPAPVTALWQKLRPEWEKTLAAQEGDGIPFTVDPREDLVSFSERIKTSDPRDLMGAERKVRKLLDARQAGQEGFISPDLAARLGLTVGGGVTGAAVDDEDPVRGALLGAGAGFTLASAPAIARAIKTGAPNLARNAEALRYFSMLSGPVTQAKNVVGNVGAVGMKTLEHALEGKPNAMAPMRELFSSKTLDDLVREFKTPQPGRWGQVTGPLGLPGRAMGAVDAATKDALARAGITPEEARLITFTNVPKSASGKAFVDFTRRAPLARMVVPFSQTATNIVERGIERTPILGLVAQLASQGKLETSLGRQVLGLAALTAGSQMGKLPPVLQAILAPYTLPYAAGVGIGEKLNANKSDADALMGGWNAMLDQAPLPTGSTSYDPRQWLAQLVPNALKDISPVDPKTLDTKSVPLFGPAIAKFPFLNEALLKKKKPTARTAKGRTARSSR